MVRDPRAVLSFALAVMLAVVAVICGSMWLGAELSRSRCAARTAAQARTIDSLVRANDSLTTTLHVYVCIQPGHPPTLRSC